MLVLDLNPVVRDIIETALKEAQPVWIGMTAAEKELWERRALWLIETTHNRYENGNTVSWKTDHRLVVDGCLLSVTRNGAPFTAALLYRPRPMNIGDLIMVVPGAITFVGQIPWRDG